MNKLTPRWLLLAAGIIMAGFLSACNSGNSSPTNDTQTTQVSFLPDGTAVLPDGTHISTSSAFVSMAEGRNSGVVTKVTGPTSFGDLGLEVDPVSQVTGVVNQEDTDVGQITFQSGSASQGNYLLSVRASKLSGQPVVAMVNVSVSNSSFIKAAYVDTAATGSLATITSGGYKSYNVLIYGFADTTTSSTNATMLSALTTAMASESTGTINLLSIGGQYGSADTMSNTATVVTNISAQIESYNSQLTTGKIHGVDLDLEGSFTASQISELASGFKKKGYVVAVAPQVYTNTWNGAVSSSSPTNLVLTSGSPNSLQNNYQPAIASGNVDYIFVQAYNSGDWTIDGYQESNVLFYKAAATALNNSVKSDCSAYSESSSSICIPETTQITIGTVVNGAAGTNTANIFNINCTTTSQCISGSYNQTSILNSLKVSIDEMVAASSTYKHYNGIMMWSGNTDYAPNLYGDYAATVGGFSSIMYGAESSGSSSGKYFILQVSNTGDGSGSFPYATASLKVNGANYEFGGVSSAGTSTALAFGTNKSWGTLASAQDPNTSSYVTDSSNLDLLFANTDSITLSGIQINKYSDENKTKTGTAAACSNLSITTLSAGHTYNVMVNPTYNSCEITQVN